MNWENALFYLVFTGQIILISWYLPNKLLSRMKAVIQTYPHTEYAKLYPKPIEYYKMGHAAYRIINWVIFALGFFVIYSIYRLDQGAISEAWVAGYGCIQFLPLVLLEVLECGQFRLMRKANSATVRRAQLGRRRLFGFISPILFGTAVALIPMTILFDLYVHQFVFEWGNDVSVRSITLIGTNLLVGLIGAKALYGRKPDPHQSTDDRARQIATSLKSLAYVSIAASVFFIVAITDDIVDLTYFEPTIMSAYFQAIVLLSIGTVLRSTKLEDIDFEVYRTKPAAT